MNLFMQKLKALFNDERGVTSLEYALLGSLIAVAIVAGVTNVGTVVQGLYEHVATMVIAAVQ